MPCPCFMGFFKRFGEGSWTRVSLLNESKVAEAKRKSRSDSWCVHTVWGWQVGETALCQQAGAKFLDIPGLPKIVITELPEEAMSWMAVSFHWKQRFCKPQEISLHTLFCFPDKEKHWCLSVPREDFKLSRIPRGQVHRVQMEICSTCQAGMSIPHFHRDEMPVVNPCRLIPLTLCCDVGQSHWPPQLTLLDIESHFPCVLCLLCPVTYFQAEHPWLERTHLS